MANTLISVLGGDDLVGKAYFNGKYIDLNKAIMDAFNRTHGAFTSWKRAIESDDPADWKRANQLLKTAFGGS